MKESRYYTPELEEFHVGFRYIELWGLENINQEYISTVFTENDSAQYLVDNFRTKYLDQQDIEELGWEYTGRTTELWFGIPETYTQVCNLTYRSFRLSYNLEDHRCRILGYEYPKYTDISGDNDVLFFGTIKNYNELKTLMKQINII